MVRKGAGQHVTRLYKVDPCIWTPNEIDSGGQCTIRPEPRESNGSRVKGSPDVNHAAITKKGEESRTTFPGRVQRIGAPPIHRPIKDGIEIPADKGGRRRVNLGGNEIEESISIWVPVRGVDASNTKRHIMPQEFS